MIESFASCPGLGYKFYVYDSTGIMTKAPFIHLRNHSAYSLAEGAIRVKELVDLALQHGMPAVAMTDSGNLFGAMEFSLAAAKAGIQPILGCQLLIQVNENLHEHLQKQVDLPKMVFLVQNQEGYKNLLKMVSNSFLRQNSSITQPHVTLSELESYGHGLIALCGGREGPLHKLLIGKDMAGAQALLERLKTCFGNRLYLEIQRHHYRDELFLESSLLALADQLNVPIVATNDVYFSTPDYYEAHDALLCVAEGTYVSEQNRRRVTPEHYFKSDKAMRELFKDLPEAIENSIIIAQRCAFMLEPSKPLLPLFPTEKGEEVELREQAKEGLLKRLEQQVYQSKMTTVEKEALEKEYFDRLHYELDVIVRMGYAGYYLIVADFIQWARRQEIPVGPGRGSGAGSLVAWSLTITDIDPIRWGLIFERFLNPERVSMPDFDIDFCQERRDEVIHYVADKYGRDRVAQIITFGKLQARAVLRDAGRVLGMPYGQVDKISKMIPNNPTNPVTLEQAIDQEPQLQAMEKEDPSVAKLLSISKKLEGLYRHASTHAAGVVIADRPLSEGVGLYHDGKSAMAATQFNMKDVETAGLVKFDFLGLKTLTIIQKTADLLKNRGIEIDISTIPLDDPKTYQMLQRVETVGVFQVEGAGMRDVLRRMQPNRFEDLIAQVALYRPGPMDDIPRYIACKHGHEKVHYLHKDLETILEETHGVMVYQEQVMKIAQVLGGYSLGGADLLRRAMGKKIKKEMDAQRQIFLEGAASKAIDSAVATQIFDQMAKFAGYGFNKSHSAPYALITYQTAYLKANYPVEFMAATMTFEMNNVDKLSLFRQELLRMGIKLLPPDVNKSFAEFAVEKDEEGQYVVRYALSAIKNVGAASIQLMVEERNERGLYKDVFDFAKRLDTKTVNRRQLENLISAGAFDALHTQRSQLMRAVDQILGYVGEQRQAREASQTSLFGNASEGALSTSHRLPDVDPWSPMEKAQKEFDAVGFYFSSHPLESYGAELESLSLTSSSELLEKLALHHQTLNLAGVVIAKNERLSKNGQRYAFVQFSDRHGIFEVTFFSEHYVKYREQLEPGNCFFLKILGRLEEDNLRLTVQDVMPLVEALEAPHLHSKVARASCNYKIVINNQDDAEVFSRIRTILLGGGEGKNKVQLIIGSGQTAMKITLPETYNLNDIVRARILNVPGIQEMVVL